MEHDRSPFDSLGDPAEVWAELMAFTHSARFLSETTSRLMEEYPRSLSDSGRKQPICWKIAADW